jgi:phosphoglycerate-specific signal transduction histidine kinase
MAFAEQKLGSIHACQHLPMSRLIKLSTLTEKQVRLDVSDSGSGLPSDLDPSLATSLGHLFSR